MKTYLMCCFLAATAVVAGGCGGDTDSGQGGDTSDGSSDTTSEPGDTDGSDGEDPSEVDVCLPDGPYGTCDENPGCQCLLGATVYEFCTANCTESADCGDAADFPGAIPGCFPINPGAANMICALVCQDTSDCPCGLECMPSGVGNTNICAAWQ